LALRVACVQAKENRGLWRAELTKVVIVDELIQGADRDVLNHRRHCCADKQFVTKSIDEQNVLRHLCLGDKAILNDVKLPLIRHHILRNVDLVQLEKSIDVLGEPEACNADNFLTKTNCAHVVNGLQKLHLLAFKESQGGISAKDHEQVKRGGNFQDIDRRQKTNAVRPILVDLSVE